MIHKKFPVLGSSENPNNLAMTVKGILLGLVPIAVIIFTNVGIDITSGELTEIVNAVVALIAGVVTVIGLVRKIMNK